MTAHGPLMDDLASLMTNATGVAQGTRREAEVTFASYCEQWLAEQDVPSREELEVVQEMARKAREDNEALATRVRELEVMLKVAQKDGQETDQPTEEAGLPPLVLQEEVNDSTSESGLLSMVRVQPPSPAPAGRLGIARRAVSSGCWPQRGISNYIGLECLGFRLFRNHVSYF